MATTSKLENSGRNWGLIGVVAGAIGASICCIGPLVLLALGIGGAWVGSLTALEPYRPIFMVITFTFLGYAFYRVYRKPKVECEPGSACATPKGNRFNKVSLWAVTVLAIGLMAFPYIAPGLASAGQQSTAAVNSNSMETVLTVYGMTCEGCTVTAQKSLASVDGVVSAEVTLNPPQAIVKYDPEKVKPEDLTKATESVGYTSEVKQ
ncbi:MAG: mercuric transporter MerT family protein [Calditrichia bacterium]